ncbi:galactoside 2-alpha-L-fucosyltransferase-like isoform X1 [Gigaspora margarita]|uniref:Galactoside 2-alpha-L-fucosyltransferase-like isoform X1 n=1 Tax=Gigaspora margarita TaxID=4874 RepID=A0A8H4A4P7_GIGMA|nr:galactoside 2-alpha-L-fucosyltransferase-like isoform X1 [Gigaspora margarita]
MTKLLKSKWHLILFAIIFLCLILFFMELYIDKFLEVTFPVEKKNITSIMTSVEDFEKEQKQKFSKFNALYDNYIKKHNNALENLMKLEQSSISISERLPKVVVVKPDMKTGFGNKFPGIVCGFLYSIITDRLFFIEGYENFEDHFEKDFEHNWKKVAHLYNKSSIKRLHNIRENEFSLITRGNLNSEEVNSYDILNVTTWDYACVPIMSNPNHKKQISEIIPDYKIFTVISQKLLRLKSDINKRVKTFINNNFGEYNIGIHLRMKKLSKITRTKGMIIPIKHYCQVVEMLLIGIEKKNVTIFIAADTNESRKALINCIHKSLNSYSKGFVKIVYVNNNMKTKNPINHNPGTEISALIDMKILSFCDDLVLTFGSTFGYVAAGWSYRSLSRLRGPFVVMPMRNTTEDFAVDKIWLWQSGSNDPCMYLGKWLMKNADRKTVEIFKTNPFWMHYVQGCP